MKLHNITFTLLFFITAEISAQPVIEWQRNYGGSLTDYGYTVTVTDAGDYFFAGLSYSNDDDVTGHHGSSSDADVWVLKTDPDGNILWQNSFGGNKGEYAKSITPTDDGGCIFSSACYSNNGDVTGHYGATFKTDIWVVKLSDAGAIEWERSLGGTNLENVANILVNDAGYIICGSTNSNNGDITSIHSTNYDAWIVQLDTDGNIIWQKCFGGSGVELASRIFETADGNYVIAGTSSSADGDVSVHIGLYDVWIFEIDPDGNLLWEKSYGGLSDDWGIDVLQYGDDLIIAGDVRSAGGDISFNHGEDDFWLARIDASGNIIWEKCYGGSDDDVITDIALSGDKIIAIGTASSEDGDITGNHGPTDYWLLQTTMDGFMDWQKCYGGSTSDAGFAITPAEDHTVLLAGYSLSMDGDITDPLGAPDMSIFKVNTCTAEAPEIISTATSITACEGDEISVFLEATGDITGYTWIKDGSTEAGTDAELYILNADAADAGTYICQVEYACGYISSEAYTITVNAAPPAVIIALGDLNICETGNVDLSASAGDGFVYQWYYDATDIAGATDQIFNAVITGNYSVDITDSIGCSAHSEKTTVIDSCGDALTNIDGDLMFAISPNPADALITIRFDLPYAQDCMISLYNMKGENIYEKLFNAAEGKNTVLVSLEDLSAGMYLLKADSEALHTASVFIKN